MYERRREVEVERRRRTTVGLYLESLIAIRARGALSNVDG
jgi:hypothetical protein